MQVPADSLLGAALVYGGLGWPIFPCHPDKRPATAHGFHDATCDPERITRWWSRHDSLIGMPVRPGFAVVDVDDFDGFDELASRGMAVPDTLTAATPRGQHLWYRTRRPVRPTVGVVPHVDLRGPGSYVIVPPSPGYRWLVLRSIADGLD